MEVDRDDSPINWINKLGKTPESSPQHSNNNHSQSKKRLNKLPQQQALNPPLSTANTLKLEKIDQINTKIRTLLQNVKDESVQPASFYEPSTLLKANPNSYNVRTNYQSGDVAALTKAFASNLNYPSSYRREDSENRYPATTSGTATNSPKGNSTRKSKNKLATTSDLYRHESAC